jgi:uncharacterized protein
MDRITFETADGLALEGEIRHPDGPPAGLAVLCHADPRYGGSKDHPLLWAIRIELAARRRLVVLSFNFRGVMGSEGEFGGGTAEIEDVRAAISRVRRELEAPAFVCGWSFGARVALREAIGDDRVAALALVGFPLAEAEGVVPPPPPPPEDLAAVRSPVLLLSGDADPFSPPAELDRLARQLSQGTVHVVEGTDHYFGRREREAAAIVGAFAENALSAGSA